MSLTVEAIPLSVPSLGAANAGSGIVAAQAQPAAHADGKPRTASGADGITPVPIQPLSNQMLATFMEKDIALYGSTVGA
jgi:hypothetical protein